MDSLTVIDKRQDFSRSYIGNDDFICKEEREARERIAELAKVIKNNAQLRKVVRNAKYFLREDVYKMIVPHLKFKALPFYRM